MDVKKVRCLWCKKAIERADQVCSNECLDDVHHAEKLLCSLESDLKHLKEQFNSFSEHLSEFSEFVEETRSRVAPRTPISSRVPKKLDEDALGLARKIDQMEKEIQSLHDRLS